MTEQREPQAEAVDPGLEVKPEVISDLDVPSDDVEHIAGASLIRCTE